MTTKHEVQTALEDRYDVEALRWPLLATCGVCSGSLEIYPYPAPAGSGYCQNCSPTWLRSFLEFATKDTASRGWKPRAERDQ